MSKTRNWFHSIFSAKKESKWVKILLSPLCLLSFFYGSAMRIRAWLYARGFFPSHSLSAKVISVGNITLGGTGKTPFASFLAEAVPARGFRAAVLSRGYKGNYAGPCGVVSNGKKILMTPRESGDESYLLAGALKGVPVLVGKKRRISGDFAVESFKSQVVILDDGFQHLALKRDINFLLLDAQNLFGNGWVFPRGPLREPMNQVKRADAVILTKCDQSDNIKKLKRNLNEIAGNLPIFATHYIPAGIKPRGETDIFSVDLLKNRKVWAFTGIGDPDSFHRTLTTLGARVVGFEAFPDHYWFKYEDFQRLAREGEAGGAEVLITTEKDMIRLEGFTPGKLSLWAVAVKHEFLENSRKEFEEFLWIKAGIGQ